MSTGFDCVGLSLNAFADETGKVTRDRDDNEEAG